MYVDQGRNMAVDLDANELGSTKKVGLTCLMEIDKVCKLSCLEVVYLEAIFTSEKLNTSEERNSLGRQNFSSLKVQI